MIDEALDHYSMDRMTKPMQMIALMQEFHWTYDDYMNTPNYVITLILEKMTRDNKARELAAKRNEYGG